MYPGRGVLGVELRRGAKGLDSFYVSLKTSKRQTKEVPRVGILALRSRPSLREIHESQPVFTLLNGQASQVPLS
jgi:hypothetical protein